MHLTVRTSSEMPIEYSKDTIELAKTHGVQPEHHGALQMLMECSQDTIALVNAYEMQP